MRSRRRPHGRAPLRTGGAIGLLCALALALAACAGESTTAGEGSGDADVAGAARRIERFARVPAFTAPGPPLDPARLRGARIVEIPITSQVPFIAAVEEGMRRAAEAVGAELVVYPNQGRP
ncbi:MAG TPA: hypothetical protein VK904_00860, partial [Miltoncostaeaceae bacterium]|nr:hypothetical protein [Miltoncostaeaceae bacterium]